MAACSEQSLESIDPLLECAICMDKLSDPHVLPCSHTFCWKCLIRHYEWCTAAQGADKNYLIKCPTCRQTWPLPADTRVDQPSSSAADECPFDRADNNVSIPHPLCDNRVSADINSFF